MKKVIDWCLLSIFIFLVESAWSLEIIKECNEGNMVILQDEYQNYRIMMRGNSLDYFIDRGAIPLSSVNQRHEFVNSLIKEKDHFISVVSHPSGEQVLFDLYDYGNVTLIATSHGKEIAAWHYKYCRN